MRVRCAGCKAGFLLPRVMHLALSEGKMPPDEQYYFRSGNRVMNIEERLDRIESLLTVLVERQQTKDWYTTEELVLLARRSSRCANGAGSGG